MYELEYVKKRQRRRLAAIIGGISTVVVSTLCITAFLGRFVGTFTVSLDTGNVSLTLSRKKDLSLSTSFLRVDDLPEFHEYTYSSFEDIGTDVIDSEDTDIEIGANHIRDDGSIDGLNFFKYTFYVANVGSVPARYDFKVNVLDRTVSEDDRDLLDTIRVMIFENGEEHLHQSKVYAKPYKNAPSHYEGGIAKYNAPISISEELADATHPFQGYAEEFENESVITTLSVNNFEVSEIKRYTIVTWLEGFASASDKQAPKGASIKIGVEINAYEI